MATDDFGLGVSYTYDENGYNYDTVVFEAHKPPLDTELNYSQQIAGLITRRQMSGLPSGWITLYPTYTNTALQNNFYTQNPTGAKPEYALVNGQVVYVTGTGVKTKNSTNANLIELGDAPTTGNRINGVFLEVWRALLTANDSTNKPAPASIIDSFRDIYVYDSNNSWICGDNGILLNTQNGGQTWNIQAINTQRQLNGLSFITSTIGYVVGNAGLIARTASGGTSWTVLQAVTGEDLNDIFTIDQVTSIAVGTSGIILKTTNGVSFGALASGVTSRLNKVHFYDNQVGWVVGDGGVILKTTSGGAVWLKQVSNTLVNLHSIFFYDLNYGFAVGDNGVILKTSDGGSSWVNQSGNIYANSAFTTTTESLRDVTMVPNLDRVVTEEVSSQANGVNKTFTVSNIPVTIGDGKGTTTNDVNNVSVTVNGVAAAVDALNGTSGEVTLNVAPAIGATVKITYYYLEECALFRGKAWIVGTNGKVFYTDDVGAKWQPQTSNTAYDLLAIDFITEFKGWLVGSNSVIQYTENGGTSWGAQQSELSARSVQQVFSEGNVNSQTYLIDQSIHPDANVETTKRVQVQYKVRILGNADPVYTPEAGLSSAVLGEGPNSSGSYAYESMGPINGDYGCWRAECLNTVDGFCYAIPMFFVNRRNSSSYDPAGNANGSYQTGFVRPDMLTATMIVDQDILDVRRRVVLPSVSELLPTSFDKLTTNLLKTNFSRTSVGGDQYGTELLQIDRIGGSGTEGGTQIGATIDDANTGKVSSEVVVSQSTTVLAANPVPPLVAQNLNLVGGFYHPNPAFYKATYLSGTATVTGKSIPGYFTGVGTSQPTFVFGNNVLTTTSGDSLLTSYNFSAPWYGDSTRALSYVPSRPQLVKNFRAGNSSFYYQGVLDSTSAKVIESWDSGVYGYQNYALAYSYQAGDPNLQYRASPVELHYFMQVPDTSSTISVPIQVQVAAADPVTYNIHSIRRVNNITAGFSHRMSNQGISGSTITITAAPGYNFVMGHILEVVAQVDSADGDNNVRNGAAVNFNQGLRGISEFFLSEWREVTFTSPHTSTTIPSLHGEIFYGISTIETGTSLDQTAAWSNGTMFPITSVSGLGTSSLLISWSTPITSLQIQLLEKRLYYTAPNGNLLIGYDYVPYQTPALPPSVTGNIITSPSSMYVSNLGAGGGALGEVYSNPIEQIPVSGTTFSNDLMFHNKIPLQFANFTVEEGFAQLPVINPALIPTEITFSNPMSDSLGRTYYQTCSKDLIYQGEGLQLTVGRKIYLPALFRINDPSNQIFVNGEYVLVVFSRAVLNDRENITGSFSGGDCSIAIYRLPNRPTSRI